ncbi:MAG: TetR/AcrR family transcriptional regulator [Bacteroidales bacterium]|jgi:AcrR family transcriptional regulator|nr:TetR/AcrR family transcriptional regulator [Bacteroidales bacterium]
MAGKKTSGHITRAKIIEKSFKLFCMKQYDRVTYTEIERATDLRRGSILYHFKTKQELFEAVVETMLLNWSAALDVPMPEGDMLKNFIEKFVDNCTTMKKTAAAQGIKNIHLAYYTIENAAFCNFNDFDKRLRQTRDVENRIWTNVLTRAIEKKEIDDTVEPEIFARLFMNIYYGYVYSSIRDIDGGNICLLREDLFALYNRIKKK